MLLAILLVPLFVMSRINDSAALAKNETSWMYKCVSNMGCQQVQRTGFMDHHSGHYKNIEICHTMCRNHVTIWPLPLKTTFGQKTVRIHPRFFRFNYHNVPEKVRALLQRMIRVAIQKLQAQCRSRIVPVIFYFFIKNDNSKLFWNMDESYFLNVQIKDRKIHVEVKAPTVFGARHALETFSQLVTHGGPKKTASDNCNLHLPVPTKITDAPAYTHRGLMLDTARHFIPLENIKKMIEGMGATKMNVFHWHVTDSQSFPLQSLRVPQLARYGAYSPTKIYSTAQVRELVDFAMLHGVRVVIEIDTPAHAGKGWQWGKDENLGDLAVCVNSDPSRSYCAQFGPCGQLNPLNPNTFNVLEKLYKDISDLLPNPALLHFGGDEIDFDCWNSSEGIQALMIKRGLDLSTKSFYTIWAEFHNKALNIWEEIVKTKPTVMIWSSPLTTPYQLSQYQFLDKKRYVIEVWEEKKNPLLGQLLDLGYRIVSAPKNAWYLDWDTKWVDMYSHVLPNDKNVLGGEAPVWTERIDANTLDAYTWPRAAELAETLRLNTKTNAVLAKPLLKMHRERLINRALRPNMESP